MSFSALEPDFQSQIAAQYIILMADCPDYGMKVKESFDYAGKTLSDLAEIIKERKINLSLMCPRKLPEFIK